MTVKYLKFEIERPRKLFATSITPRLVLQTHIYLSRVTTMGWEGVKKNRLGGGVQNLQPLGARYYKDIQNHVTQTVQGHGYFSKIVEIYS